MKYYDGYAYGEVTIVSNLGIKVMFNGDWDIAYWYYREEELELVEDYKELEYALEESVKLQSHYAELLNMHDGGKRIQFKNAKEWLLRLRELDKKKK